MFMGDLQHLNGQDTVSKIKTIVDHTNTCMFCTGLEEIPFSTRPMATQEVDDDGNIWFLSGKDSHKNQDVQQDHQVQLIYANPDKSEYLSVTGMATIYTDREKIEAVWSPMAKAWFTEGKDDPNLTVIRVRPQQGYYWDTKNGKMVSLIKIAAGAITGTTMDDGIEGKLKL